ncbi:MAG: lysophospholipid acyltransferase family protein [Rhodocyclales bacterium]|nr:lysophospholipid acyltransferase family protein [Rhodocyclales bacterium]
MPLLPVGLRLLLVGLHLLYGALLVALLFRLGGAPWHQHLKRHWSRQLLVLLGIRVEADAGELARIEAGLLVGNHISFIDIFVINTLLPCGFVAKSEVARWPLIGWLSRHADTVFIERGSRKAAQRAQQQMLKALRTGRRLAIFPEGTTTAGDRLLPFHGALFQSAIDAAVPVHALALSYHRADGARSLAPAYIDDISLLTCLISVLQAGGLVARVTLAASFAPPLSDRRHLAHRAHQAVAAALAHSEDSSQPLRNEAAINW